jgi:Secretion system C-terminal sorting domain
VWGGFFLCKCPFVLLFVVCFLKRGVFFINFSIFNIFPNPNQMKQFLFNKLFFVLLLLIAKGATAQTLSVCTAANGDTKLSIVGGTAYTRVVIFDTDGLQYSTNGHFDYTFAYGEIATFTPFDIPVSYTIFEDDGRGGAIASNGYSDQLNPSGDGVTFEYPETIVPVTPIPVSSGACFVPTSYTFTGTGDWTDPAHWDYYPDPTQSTTLPITINGVCTISNIPFIPSIGISIALNNITLNGTLINNNIGHIQIGNLTISGNSSFVNNFSVSIGKVTNNGSFISNNNTSLVLDTIVNNGVFEINDGFNSILSIVNNGTFNKNNTFGRISSCYLINNGVVNCIALHPEEAYFVTNNITGSITSSGYTFMAKLTNYGTVLCNLLECAQYSRNYGTIVVSSSRFNYQSITNYATGTLSLGMSEGARLINYGNVSGNLRFDTLNNHGIQTGSISESNDPNSLQHLFRLFQNTGTFTGQCTNPLITITNSGTFNQTGNTELNTLFTNSGTLNNTGVLTLNGGLGNYSNIENSGELTIATTAATNQLNATILNRPAGIWHNSIEFTNLGSITNDGDFTNTDFIYNYSLITNNGTLRNNGTITNWYYGVLNNSATGVLQGSGALSGSFASSGTVSPGNSPGCLSFTNNFTSTGNINIEIGGSAGCSEYDKINVTGTANLSGVLNVSLVNGFRPAAGSNFTLINAATRTGNFSTINYPSGYTWQPVYDGTSVKLTVVTVLPIKLLSFTVSAQKHTNYLEWTSASEQNSAYFNIERSEDGVSFYPIGQVTAAGNSSSERKYSFEDKQHKAIAYYRLKMTDLDGSFEYSKVVSIGNTAQANVEIYPNPTDKDEITLSYSATQNGKISVFIYNAIGQIVYQTEINTTVGINTETLNLPALSAGVYLLKTADESNKVLIRKIIKN